MDGDVCERQLRSLDSRAPPPSRGQALCANDEWCAGKRLVGLEDSSHPTRSKGRILREFSYGYRLRRRRTLDLADSHGVEGPPNENHRDDEESGRELIFESRVARLQTDGEFHRQQAEQRRELDDRIHGHGRRVFERIADGVADDGRGVQVGPFGFHIDFDDFFGVVPRPAGIGHEDGLVQTEHGDRNQIPDKEKRLDKGKR